MRLVEISSLAQLRTWLVEGRPLTGLRLQDLDLGPGEPQLLRRADVDGLVVLGGRVSRTLVAHLQAHGAVVFARNDTAPVDVFRAHLYTGPELYAGLSGPGGYADTVDSRAYAWSRDARLSRDAYATLLRAIHDDSMSDALSEWVEGRRVVGIMGGHEANRGTPGYAASAHLGRDLAAAGFLVATGGGPGAWRRPTSGRSPLRRRPGGGAGDPGAGPLLPTGRGGLGTRRVRGARVVVRAGGHAEAAIARDPNLVLRA